MGYWGGGGGLYKDDPPPPGPSPLRYELNEKDRETNQSAHNHHRKIKNHILHPLHDVLRLSPCWSFPPVRPANTTPATNVPHLPHQARHHQQQSRLHIFIRWWLVLELLLLDGTRSTAGAANSLQQSCAREPERKSPTGVVEGGAGAPSQAQTGGRELPLRECCQYRRRGGGCG